MAITEDRTTKMEIQLEDARAQIEALCSRLEITQLDLFGSAAAGEMDDDSDVDVLVTFADGVDDLFNRYFMLKEELEALFSRPIDIVTSASLRNPYFRSSVERSRVNVYTRSSSKTSV